jgi:hypothetical protein
MAAPSTAKLDKAMIEIFEAVVQGNQLTAGSALGRLQFQFNPKDYSLSRQAAWKLTPQKKASEPPEFNGNEPGTLSVEVFLDGTDSDVPRDVLGEVELLFTCLEPTADSKRNNRPLPPMVVFTWGTGPRFEGVVKSVNAAFSLFEGDGQPLRATVKLAIQEFKSAYGRQNPTSGSPRIRRSHTVVLGDSLMSIASTYYGAPTWWRAIAKTNQIHDPFELRPGTWLLVPPADEAKVLA